MERAPEDRATSARRRRFALALLVQLCVAPFLVHDWDGFVFERSARDLLQGETPYEVAQEAPHHVFLDNRWPPANSWYAYPPLELLLVTPFVALGSAVSAAPWVARVALKLPIIAGGLALAYVSGRLVHHLAQGAPEEKERKRARVEALLLFNPFLIFISAAWGMFDATMAALLVASLLLLVERDRPAWAGAAFGAAALVKVFPLFVSPMVAWYVWRSRSLRDAKRYVAAAVAVFAVVSLPFFLRSPAGFLEQVLLLHAARPPQGFALVSAPLHFPFLEATFGWPLPSVPPSVISDASLALLAALVLVLHLRARDLRTMEQLLVLVAATFVGMLLVSKVVNEQYLVMPVALLAVLAVLKADDARWARAYRAFAWGGLVSSLLLGFHFLTFIPPDVAALLPFPPEALVGAAAISTDLPVGVVIMAPHLVATAALVPALVAGAWLVGREARAVWRPPDAPAWPRGRRAALALAVALAVVAPMAVPAAVHGAPAAPAPPAPAAPLRAVAFEYDLTLGNPWHDPDRRGGAWDAWPDVAPADGFYTVNLAKLRADMDDVRALGGNAIVAPVDAANRVPQPEVLAAARDAGLLVMPSIDARHLAHCPSAHWVPPSTLPGGARTGQAAERAFAGCLRDAFAAGLEDPSYLRLGGRVVLRVTHADANATWMAEAAHALGDVLLVAGHPAEEAPPAWADATHPLAPPALDEAARAAFEAATRADAATAVAAVFPAAAADTGGDALAWSCGLAGAPDLAVLPWNTYRDARHVEPGDGNDPRDAVASCISRMEVRPDAT